MYHVFAGESQNDPADKAAGWFAAMTFLLFVNYAIFGGMLAIFRSDLVKDVDGAAAGAQGEGSVEKTSVEAGDGN